MKRILSWLAPLLLLASAHAQTVDPPRKILRVEGTTAATTHCDTNYGGWSEQWSTDGSTLSQCAAAATWAPEDLSDLKFWFEVVAANVTEDVDGITNLDDLSIDDNDLTQATGSLKPDRLSSWSGVSDAADHDGVDDVLALDTSLAQTGVVTLGLSFELDALSATSRGLWGGPASNDSPMVINHAANVEYMWSNVSGTFVQITNSTRLLSGSRWTVVVVRDSSNVWRGWVNGTEESTSNTQAGDVDFSFLLGEGGNRTDGKWGRSAMWGADHSSNVSDIFGWLNTGIY